MPLEGSWGALLTFFSGSWVWLARSPRTPSPGFVQLGISGLALLIGAEADSGPLGLALVTAVSGLLLRLLAGRPLTLIGRPSLARGM